MMEHMDDLEPNAFALEVVKANQYCNHQMRQQAPRPHVFQFAFRCSSVTYPQCKS